MKILAETLLAFKEHVMRSTAIAMMLILGIAGCNNTNKPVTETSTDGQRTSADTDRDNTGINARDRDGVNKVPTDQHNDQSDVDITAEIRSRIGDTEMSTNAQNVKIITENGRVTLRGPVDSDAEKRQVERIASDVAGTDNVKSELEIE